MTRRLPPQKGTQRMNDDLIAIEEVKEKTAVAVSEMRIVAIENADQANQVGGYLRECTRLRKEVESAFKPIKDAQNAALKATREQEKKFLEPIEVVEMAARREMAGWQQREERRIAEERRERDRIAREEAEARQLQLAKDLEAFGEDEAAINVLDQHVSTFAEPVVAVAEPVKVEGISYRSVWSARVVDLATLVKAVADGKAELNLIMANEPALNGLARALKASMSVPGVIVEERKVANVR
jgi:hypothetical protein